MDDRVCVIGAGSSGIATCQVLAARGIPFDCFEAGSQVGGNWRYGNDNEMSSAYRSLHINSSKQSMQYASYPMPDSYPDYCGHAAIARYFDDFVDHFGLLDAITFRTTVTSVRAAGGRWEVRTRDRDTGEERTGTYAAVLVASGHHWDPRLPTPAIPGAETFPGEQVHSHFYRTPEIFAGKRVVVVGIGNSASDVASESSQVAEHTTLSVRRGAHVVPKYLFGVPTDHLTLSKAERLPFWLQRKVLRLLVGISRGKITGYGLPKPDHDILCAHPTMSDGLLSRLAHGDIQVRPAIARIDGDTVYYRDGSAETADMIVYCTGYKISFPFLEPTALATTDNLVSLYQRVVPLDRPGLYFIGLVQPIGAIMPLAELQSEWVADLLQGRATLPAATEMAREIQRHRHAIDRRYVRSARHTIQVDFLDYIRALTKERQVGRTRHGRSVALATRPEAPALTTH
jgi:cation diffusion facilitator CzcD-associated flavoprotein CzcO